MPASPQLTEAFNRAGRSVARIVNAIEASRDHLPQLVGERAALSYQRSATAMQRLWAAAWADWNIGNYRRAARTMLIATQEAARIERQVGDALASGYMDVAMRTIVENTPLRFVRESNQIAQAAARAITEAPEGIPRPGVPMWVKAIGALALVAGGVWAYRKFS